MQSSRSPASCASRAWGSLHAPIVPGRQGLISTRTITDALVVDTVRDVAWMIVTLTDGTTRRKMTPEGLYGRRKWPPLIRRTRIAWRGLLGVGGPRDAHCWVCQGVTGGSRRSAPPSPVGRHPSRRPAQPRLHRRRPQTVSGSPISPMSAPGPAGCTSRSSSTCSRNASWPGTRRPTNTSTWS